MTHDESGGGWGVLAGSGIVLMELFVLAPGLLPLVLITSVFAVPFLLPLIPVLILAGPFFAVRKLWRAVSASRRGR
jgi:hypothetical protein